MNLCVNAVAAMPDADFDRGMGDCLLGGQTWRGRLTSRRKDGTLWASQVIITPVRDAQGTLTGSGRAAARD